MITYKAYCYKRDYYKRFDKHPPRPKSWYYGYSPWGILITPWYLDEKLNNAIEQLKGLNYE